MDHTTFQRRQYALWALQISCKWQMLYPEEINLIKEKMSRMRHNWYRGTGERCRFCNSILPLESSETTPPCQRCHHEKGVAELSGRLSQVHIS